MHGFTWTPRAVSSTVDDPHGVGTTTINGVNDNGQLVGFYVDAAGNTDGSPRHAAPVTPSDPVSYWPPRPGRSPAGRPAPCQPGGVEPGGGGSVQVEASGPPNQASMMCRAIDTGGGRAISRALIAASSSSRLNQCASASSS